MARDNRCYLRGWTPLGLFNSLVGCLFNRVLVKVEDSRTGRTVRRYWDRASAHPGGKDGQYTTNRE